MKIYVGFFPVLLLAINGILFGAHLSFSLSYGFASTVLVIQWNADNPNYLCSAEFELLYGISAAQLYRPTRVPKLQEIILLTELKKKSPVNIC